MFEFVYSLVTFFLIIKIVDKIYTSVPSTVADVSERITRTAQRNYYRETAFQHSWTIDRAVKKGSGITYSAATPTVWHDNLVLPASQRRVRWRSRRRLKIVTGAIFSSAPLCRRYNETWQFPTILSGCVVKRFVVRRLDTSLSYRTFHLVTVAISCHQYGDTGVLAGCISCGQWRATTS